MGQRHLKEIKQFVVLRHLGGPNQGACFWTTAEKDGGDNTRGNTGELWYEEVLFTNSEQEAIDTCARRGRPLHAEMP